MFKLNIPAELQKLIQSFKKQQDRIEKAVRNFIEESPIEDSLSRNLE
jgi:hypothetical protein